jgi:ribosomal-protein-alanine N-acetyltransferase
MEPEGFAFEALSDKDLDEVVEIEKLCFPTPWGRALFAEELSHGEICTWMKARDLRSAQRVAAYMGFWKAVDEAHITNLAVRPQWRRLGLGRSLALRMLEEAKRLGCLRATLEVRPSNAAALGLYESLGFSGVALRPKYYPDNEEDALIMWKNSL